MTKQTFFFRLAAAVLALASLATMASAQNIGGMLNLTQTWTGNNTHQGTETFNGSVTLAGTVNVTGPCTGCGASVGTSGQLDYVGGGGTWNVMSGVTWNSSTLQWATNGSVVAQTLSMNAPVDSGSGNSYVACGGPSLGSTLHLQAGYMASFVTFHANTSSATFTWCGLTAAITKNGAVPLIAGDIPSGDLVYVVFDGVNWQMLNPASSTTNSCPSGSHAGDVCYWNGSSWVIFAGNSGGTGWFTENTSGAPNWSAAPSGTLGGGTRGAPMAWTGSSTAGPYAATFYVQAMAGSDICAKINNALAACPNGDPDVCHIIVTATSPGNVDVCSSGTSDFWSGIGNIIVDFQLEAVIQLKAAPTWPQNTHVVHGVGSAQNTKASGFVMDPSFPTNLALTGSGEGPFPAGNYRALIVDGGRSSTSSTNNWGINAFSGHWRDLSLDCNNVPNCIAYYTANEQEGSGFDDVRVWNTASNTAGSVSACGFWDHSAATGTSNTGPSHFHIYDSGCDPYGEVSPPTAANTNYGWVYEACCGGTGNSGGNIRIEGGTMRAASSTQLMVDGVWIDGSANDTISNVHCEWLSSGCIELGAGTTATNQSVVSGISDVNHTVVNTHFYAGNGNVAFSLQGGSLEDDPNSCTVNGGSVEFYTQDDQGQGWWNGAFHICTSANSDRTGNLTFSSSTSQTYNYSSTYTIAPQCQVSPTSNPGSVVFWVTSTTSVLTIHASSSFTGNVNYECTGRGV